MTTPKDRPALKSLIAEFLAQPWPHRNADAFLSLLSKAKIRLAPEEATEEMLQAGTRAAVFLGLLEGIRPMARIEAENAWRFQLAASPYAEEPTPPGEPE